MMLPPMRMLPADAATDTIADDDATADALADVAADARCCRCQTCSADDDAAATHAADDDDCDDGCLLPLLQCTPAGALPLSR